MHVLILIIEWSYYVHGTNTIKSILYTIFLSMFISFLYMFRATMFPSSGDITVSMRHLVLVTLYGWLSGMQGGTKHVEKRNKHTKKNCASSWLFIYKINRRLFLLKAHRLTLYSPVVTICTAQWSLYVPPALTFNISTFSPHTAFMCFVRISEQTAIISLYSIITDWFL